MIPIIIQARATSRRLPGKVLMRWGDTTLLGHVIRECRRSQCPVWVATSDSRVDDGVAGEAESWRAHVYRGALDDVLARFVGCVDAMPEEPEAIVRICADRPFLSAQLIDAAVAWWRDHPKPFLNVGDGSLTVEIVATWRLRKLHEQLPNDSRHREHVTSYIAEGRRAVSTTVDTPSDYLRLAPAA